MAPEAFEVAPMPLNYGFVDGATVQGYGEWDDECGTDVQDGPPAAVLGRASQVTTSDDAGPIQTLQVQRSGRSMGCRAQPNLGLRLACPLAPILWWCFSTVTAPMAWCWNQSPQADLGTQPRGNSDL